jgi:hypothetical protein
MTASKWPSAFTFAATSFICATLDISNHNRLRFGNLGHRFAPALFVARVQNGIVSLLKQKLRGHSPETIRRTGNKNSCHMLGKRCVIV